MIGDPEGMLRALLDFAALLLRWFPAFFRSRKEQAIAEPTEDVKLEEIDTGRWALCQILGEPKLRHGLSPASYRVVHGGAHGSVVADVRVRFAEVGLQASEQVAETVYRGRDDAELGSVHLRNPGWTASR
jgi:hypothetical protein